ncbi:conserved hypothetical protein [Magnetospirillum sp. LM-5]|uniref:carboxymuconolactone decarboxylase family protein n=1 Tax=Magnetospirillum sp. LM-5 TaxID=2681466 RepID=UPI001381E409|nr:carboxymuconolactone decarboxylase family protein [Magnetospirillum sp. LM-5]CAA7619666.1 conserved hypothetical protein [Magnetospirillum sp. LM-5]
MNENMRELIAMGASAAVNCHPCMQHHLAACDRLGLDRAEVKEAVEVGQMVNRGAAAKTKCYADELFGKDTGGHGAKGGCGCG